jgi:hypothetical protein
LKANVRFLLRVCREALSKRSGDTYAVARYLQYELPTALPLEMGSVGAALGSSDGLDRALGLRLTIGEVLRTAEIILTAGSDRAGGLIGYNAQQHDLITKLKSDAEVVLADILNAEGAEPAGPADLD